MHDFAELARSARVNSIEHGFAARGEELRHAYTVNTANDDDLADYYTNRITLIIGEAIEAHEELRSGRAINETYYRADGKPEGAPFELADIVIRAMDLAEEIGVDLEALVVEKMKFNASRPFKHGKAF